MQGVKLLERDVWGHRKDIDRYFTVPDAALEAIKSMNKKGVAPDEIAKEVQKTAKLGTELIKYLANPESLLLRFLDFVRLLQLSAADHTTIFCHEIMPPT